MDYLKFFVLNQVIALAGLTFSAAYGKDSNHLPSVQAIQMSVVEFSRLLSTQRSRRELLAIATTRPDQLLYKVSDILVTDRKASFRFQIHALARFYHLQLTNVLANHSPDPLTLEAIAYLHLFETLLEHHPRRSEDLTLWRSLENLLATGSVHEPMNFRNRSHVIRFQKLTRLLHAGMATLRRPADRDVLGAHLSQWFQRYTDVEWRAEESQRNRDRLSQLPTLLSLTAQQLSAPPGPFNEPEITEPRTPKRSRNDQIPWRWWKLSCTNLLSTWFGL